MDKVTALKQSATDPRLPREERDAARAALAILAGSDGPDREAAKAALAAMGEFPALSAENPSADPEQEVMVKMFGPEVTALVEFAGVGRLREVTIAAAMDYADAQPQPIPESTMRALRGWYTFRRPNPTKVLWDWVKETHPEPERRAAFDEVIGKHPYLAHNEHGYDRHRFQHLVGLCETQSDYATRTYFLPRVVALLAELPEYAFKLRDEVKAFISKQEKRCSLTKSTP